MIKIPPFLKKGDTIGIVAPSFGATTEPYISRFNEALKKIKERGYKIKIGECCYKDDGIGISTLPQTAARELENFYLDSEVNAIISCGGGELMCETVGFVDFQKIKNAPPKWFLGYSDNTNFIFPLVTKCNVASLYGQNATGFGKPWELSEEYAFSILEGKTNFVEGFEFFQNPSLEVENPLSPYVFTDKKELKIFVPKNKNLVEISKSEMKSFDLTKEGVFLGGCLDCISNLCGTPLDNVKDFIKDKKIIWFFESCDLNPMEIRRVLWKLKECSWFETAKAFVFGRPYSAFGQELLGMNQYNAVTGILSDLNVPVIMDADLGHIDPVMPVVIGANSKVKIVDENIKIEFEF